MDEQQQQQQSNNKSCNSDGNSGWTDQKQKATTGEFCFI